MTVDQSGSDSDQDPNIVQVIRGMSLESSQEPGVAIPESDYIRLIDRLENCRSIGWGDLWVAGGGAGAGLAGAALVTVIASGPRPILWALVAIGVIIAGLSLTAYFTQRHDRDKEISELKKDMERFRKKRTTT
jgi:hypothetical protein